MVALVLMGLMALMASGARSRPRRDFDGMEKRRKRAARMFMKGATQADVARELDVSRQSASRWYSDWLSGGSKAMHGAGRAGRLPRLDQAQLKGVDRELRKGPLAHGFATDLWTLARVATVIEATTGVAYHPGHVWKLLAEIGWSVSARPDGPSRETRRPSPAGETGVAWHKWGPVDAGCGSSSRMSPGSRSSPR